MVEKLFSDKSTKFFMAFIGIVVITFVLKELSHIFLPFVIAYFLFLVFSPLNTFLEKKKIPLFLIILVDLFITVLIFWWIFNFIVASFMQFGEEAPMYAEKFSSIVRTTAVSLGIKDPYFRYFSIEQIIQKLDYKLLAGGVFSSTVSLMGGILFVIFFFVFVVIGHQTIFNAISKRFKAASTVALSNSDAENENGYSSLAEMMRSITAQIQRYIVAKVIINLGAGILVFIVLTILGVDFPLIWALFTFLFNFIPTIGSAFALILPVLMALIQYESTGFALLTAACLAGIQTVAFNIAEPAIIGKRLNLNPLLILFSVLIWGFIWGIPGMLLSVPLTAAIKIIISSSKSRDLQFISDLMSKE